MSDPMETLAEATARLHRAGYAEHWVARAGGRLHCGACGTDHDATEVTVDEVVRFEGESDPGDEAILFALSGPCDHRGLYVAAYGNDAQPADIEVEAALRR